MEVKIYLSDRDKRIIKELSIDLKNDGFYGDKYGITLREVHDLLERLLENNPQHKRYLDKIASDDEDADLYALARAVDRGEVPFK